MQRGESSQNMAGEALVADTGENVGVEPAETRLQRGFAGVQPSHTAETEENFSRSRSGVIAWFAMGQRRPDRSGKRTGFRSSRFEKMADSYLGLHSLIVTRKTDFFSAAHRSSFVDVMWLRLRRFHHDRRLFGSGRRGRLRRLLPAKPTLGQDAPDQFGELIPDGFHSRPPLRKKKGSAICRALVGTELLIPN